MNPTSVHAWWEVPRNKPEIVWVYPWFYLSFVTFVVVFPAGSFSNDVIAILNRWPQCKAMSAGPKVGELGWPFDRWTWNRWSPPNKIEMTNLNINLPNTCPTLRRFVRRIWAWALICSQGEIEELPSCPGVDAILINSTTVTSEISMMNARMAQRLGVTTKTQSLLPLFGFKSGTVSMLLRATSDHAFGDILRLAPIRLMASGCTTSSNRRGGGVPDGSCWTDARRVVVRHWQVVSLIFWMWIR